VGAKHRRSGDNGSKRNLAPFLLTQGSQTKRGRPRRGRVALFFAYAVIRASADKTRRNGAA
jgi:hypothetical protein